LKAVNKQIGEHTGITLQTKCNFLQPHVPLASCEPDIGSLDHEEGPSLKSPRVALVCGASSANNIEDTSSDKQTMLSCLS